MKLPKSKLTKKQTIEKVASWTENGNRYKMITEIRHDDCCSTDGPLNYVANCE